MGVLETLAGPLADKLSDSSYLYIFGFGVATFIAAAVILNVLSQVLSKNKSEPPVVFHWVPFFGSTIAYGMDPYKFFFENKQKYGDIYTFVLLGKKVTVFLGTKGNEFILNGKLTDVNAETIYSPLTTPVFGKDVVYDCPNAKLMEQKKFVKFGLTTEAFRSYVPLMVQEVQDFVKGKRFGADTKSGTLDVPPAMEELTLYTASRTLQGREVRSKFDSHFAELFHDLDAGFQPINFMMPWAPLPQNRRRDHANKKMAATYLEIIESRKGGKKDSEDMIWNLMQSVYKNGTPIPDREVSHMMIALLMAGQHSSATTESFILLRCAGNPHIWDELYQEQKDNLGTDADGKLSELSHENLASLTLHAQVVKETLRIHAPIHSILRQVTSPMHIEGTGWTVPAGHNLLAAPGVTSKMSQYFSDPGKWDPHRWDAKPTTTTSNLSADAISPPPSRSASAQNEKEDDDDDDDKVDYGFGVTSKGTSSPYLPFGAGRHRCIGEQFAYLQLTTILATLVREVKVWNGAEKGQGTGTVPETDYSSLFSRPLRPATLHWERREAKE